MTALVVVGLSLMAATLFALALYGLLWFPRHNVPHMQSITPVCPNCDRPIRATTMTNPDPRARLRDHFKECVS